MDASPILRYLLTASPRPAPIADLAAWWSRHRDVGQAFGAPVDRALAGAFAADRLGYAFGSGFREALRQLLPDIGAAPTALCATEVGGNRPSAIETSLIADGDGWRATGDKTWVTLGRHAEQLVVFASVGRDEGGRNRLAAVVIPAAREGVTIEALGDAPFVPEIPHARVALRCVRVEPSERLEGDGYDRYLKPFRTVEDCHVYAAALAWLLQVARRGGWPAALAERLVALVAAVRALALADPTDPAVHVGFGGVAAQLAQLLGEAEPCWATVDAETRARWQRDRRLLEVAGGARARRLEVAWQRLG